MGVVLETLISESVAPSDASPAQVAREFRGLLAAGAKLLPAGEARRRPRQLLARGYTPKHRIDLFGTRFYLTDVRQDAYIRYFVAYVVPPGAGARVLRIHPRIFYKDVSLVWRAAWMGRPSTESPRRTRVHRSGLVLARESMAASSCAICSLSSRTRSRVSTEPVWAARGAATMIDNRLQAIRRRGLQRLRWTVTRAGRLCTVHLLVGESG